MGAIVVEVAPLRAWEYDPTKVSLPSVVSPPFDVIGEAELRRLQRQDPRNVVHLTLGPGTRKVTDRFRHAERLLRTWTEEGVLREAANAIYAYECVFEHQGQRRRMRGLVLRLRLDPTYKTVIPHEETFPGPTQERIKLLRATGWDLEPIQLLYSGQNVESTLWAYLDGSGRRPDLTSPLGGAAHHLWRVTDPAVIGTVQEGFKGRKVLIADGHHRYAAAVKYAEERRTREYRSPKDAAWEYKLALLVNMEDPGLLILPTHRVVKRLKVKDPRKIIEAWSTDFLVRMVEVNDANPLADLRTQMEKEAMKGIRSLGAWMGQPPRAYLIQAKENSVSEAVAPGRSFTWRTLDVVYLQKLLLEKGMGLPEKRWGQDVTYTRDDQEAAGWVRKRKAVAVLTHLATRMPQMRAIAEAGEKMPQKSTYFLPKMLSGAVFHRIGKPTGPPSVRRITS